MVPQPGVLYVDASVKIGPEICECCFCAGFRVSLFVYSGQLSGGLSLLPWRDDLVFSSGCFYKLFDDAGDKILDRYWLLSSLWTLSSSIFRVTYISIYIFIFHMGGHVTSHMTWLFLLFFGVLIGPFKVVIA